MTWTGHEAMAGCEPGRLRAGGCHRPAVRPLHLRHHRASPRAWCATTAGTRSRCAGRSSTSTASGPGDVWWAASDVGWVVGHSYIVYAPLLVGATTVLYEGKPVGTPDAGAFWRVIAEHGVTALFTAPTAIRAIKRRTPRPRCWPSTTSPSLRTLFLAGERLDPDTYEWATGHAGRAGRRQLVADRDRLADLREPARARGVDLPLKAGSPSVPMPGFDVQVLDASSHRPAAPARRARSASGCRCPRARLPTLWDDDERFLATTCGLPRLYTHRRRRHDRRGRLSATSWGARTMSSTSPGTACRRVRSRRCSPPTPRSPSAR